MGLFGFLWKVVALAILAVIGLGAYLYFTDYEVSATIVERGDGSNNPYIVIQPDLPAISSYRYRTELDPDTHRFVCEGYNVKFHVKSQAYKVYDAENRLVYDSQSEQVRASAVECAVSNVPRGGGGILG